jgi:hypothetical protein
MMRKLLIVPAILAMASVSGSAFAQRASTGATTAIASPVGTVGSPVIGVNVGVIPQVAVLNFGGSGNQNANLQQSNQGAIGIGGNSAALGVR